MSEIKFTPKGIKERGGKEIKKEDCSFVISETKSLLGDKDKATSIELFDKKLQVGSVLIEELNDKELGKQYVQLRFVGIGPDYQGGNASLILYEKSIEYAESLNKKLLFDSSLTVPAYKSFKKLEELGYKVIENPEAQFNGNFYRAPKSWVLRVERVNKK
ncbi:MAG: hypothetical protein NTZ44_00555 [Candidatus Nomurabacteria bacterium]|nr:hypothetical protein [Candidatus Nomurabacteria bacterium]